MEHKNKDDISFRFYQGESYLALPRDPQPWVIEGLIPSGAFTLIFGNPKCRKSFLGLSLASAISDEKVELFLGKRVHKHGIVAYLQVDTPRSVWAERVEKIKSVHDITKIAFTDANLVPYPVNLNIEEIKNSLMKTIHNIKPVVLVIDTLREIHDGDENQANDVRKVIAALYEVAMDTQTAVILIAHRRKGSDKGDNILDGVRGSQQIAARMDMIIAMGQRSLKLKGRNIEDAEIHFTTDKVGAIIIAEQKDGDDNLEAVMKMEDLPSDRQKAELLASMDNIEPEKARYRIRMWRKQKDKDKKDG